jgi:hypothetical protein
MMTFFIEFPLLAAALGVLFLLLYGLTRRMAGLAAALAWLAYAAYEMAMKLRILCTGECNIRVDLLLIYPMLLLVTVAALVSFVRWLARRERLS